MLSIDSEVFSTTTNTIYQLSKSVCQCSGTCRTAAESSVKLSSTSEHIHKCNAFKNIVNVPRDLSGISSWWFCLVSNCFVLGILAEGECDEEHRSTDYLHASAFTVVFHSGVPSLQQQLSSSPRPRKQLSNLPMFFAPLFTHHSLLLTDDRHHAPASTHNFGPI